MVDSQITTPENKPALSSFSWSERDFQSESNVTSSCTGFFKLFIASVRRRAILSDRNLTKGPHNQSIPRDSANAMAIYLNCSSFRSDGQNSTPVHLSAMAVTCSPLPEEISSTRLRSFEGTTSCSMYGARASRIASRFRAAEPMGCRSR